MPENIPAPSESAPAAALAEPLRGLRVEHNNQDDAERAAFNAAVEARVAELMDAKFAMIEARLKEAAAAAPVDKTTETVENQIRPVLESLGMAFASLSAQGVGVTAPVAPEVLKAREEGHKRMVARMKAAKKAVIDAKAALKDAYGADREELERIIEANTPAYRLTHPVYLDEAFTVEKWVDSDHVQQPTIIEWPGPPNHAMVPLNQVAKEIMQFFLDSVGNMGRMTKSEELEGFNRGMRVRGAPKQERAPRVPEPFDASPYEGLQVKHKTTGRGQVKLQHVLGTIAPPAEISG